MIAQIQMRRGTTAEWAAASPVVLAAGEPGWDSTLKRLKIGDGTTAWASLPWTDYGTNPNLLHNWDFRNPVNQRGEGNVTGSGTHFLDRWKVWGTINNYVSAAKYIAITAGSSIQQRIEGVDLAGKVCTFSWINNYDTLYQLTGEFPTVAGTYNDYTFSANNSLRFSHSSSGFMFLQFYANTSTTGLRTIKLELGTFSTLAYDPPMDWAVELPKCQRFYQLRSVNNVAAEDMRPLMRITNPTITGTGPYAYSADL